MLLLMSNPRVQTARHPSLRWWDDSLLPPPPWVDVLKQLTTWVDVGDQKGSVIVSAKSLLGGNGGKRGNEHVENDPDCDHAGGDSTGWSG